MNKGIPAKYVDLLGAVNVGGMNTRNFDAIRDLCDLHLHQESGGVYVTRGEDVFYVGPHAIGSVELMPVVAEATRTVQVPKAMLAPYPVMTKTEADAEAVRKGATNLADSVLSELRGVDEPREEDTDHPRGARKLRAMSKRKN